MFVSVPVKHQVLEIIKKKRRASDFLASRSIPFMFRASASSNARLIDSLAAQGTIEDERVVAVMKRVDRADFTNCDPYLDSPQG